MNILIPPFQPLRFLTIGNASATPPAPTAGSIDLSGLTRWFAAKVWLDGTGASLTLGFENGVLTVGGGTVGGLTVSAENTAAAAGLLKYLYFGVERLPGNAEAIAAHTVRLVCTPRLAVTASTADTITFAEPHGLRVGDAIKIVAGTVSGTGITLNTEYFVIASGLTETVVKVSATRGGSALDITAAGSGLIATIGEIEIARVEVPAVAAGTAEPGAAPFVYYSVAGTRRFICDSTNGTLNLVATSAADAGRCRYHLEVAGAA